jgi:hypothetical protein
LKTIPTVQKTRGVRIPITEDDGDDDDEENNNQPSNVSLIIILNRIK